MTADELHEHLQTALHELHSEDEIDLGASIASVRTYALASIALELRAFRTMVETDGISLFPTNGLRAFVRDEARDGAPLSTARQSAEAQWAGPETHGKGGPIDG